MSYSYLLISFSNANLLEQQKNFFLMKKTNATANTLKVATMKTKYENECRHFFDLIDKKHSLKPKQFRLLDEDHNLRSQSGDKNESLVLMKIQFLKLCNLDKINEILSLTTNTATVVDDFRFKEIANDYVKSATHEILLHKEDVEKEMSPITKRINVFSSSSQTQIPSRIVKYRLDSSNINTTEEINMNLNNNGSGSDETFFSFISKEKLIDLFWSVVPREDLLLAVIVPLTIICSMCILTVVVACLLHMFNKNYRQNKMKLLLLSHNKDNDNTIGKGNIGASSSITDSTKLGINNLYPYVGFPRKLVALLNISKKIFDLECPGIIG
jgi:hypothetical protein